MQIFLILALLIAILAVIFAVQNVAVVSISFFAWHIQVSLAVALLLALGAGVLISVLVSIPGMVRRGWNNASSKKKFSSLEVERDNLKRKADEAASVREQALKKLEESEKEISDLEERLASFSAALDEAQERLNSTPPSGALPPQTPPPSASPATPAENPPADMGNNP
ncbi:hypothetical protein LARV_00484 [Longilinea arvoryzae]|uniref:Lipopolysaccharide assembly protein A domain-containing protein n=1 Tax=Longilinea arvoryzae TaxID=360412 RepID=A0A0S7B6D8_9CHLR|nr:lipopolysaccharide assembly protein LapA domain-containing protein [Longilinea arvoryzae]GAP12748.1 hypothetical protein LARV_00484 [Longilinea arvoryzae]